MMGLGFTMTLALAHGCGSSSSGGGAAPSSLGSACTSDLDCAGDMHCVGSAAPTAGQCSTCCATDSDCTSRFGPASFCQGSYQCARSCSVDADCGPGFECDSIYCKRSDCTEDRHCWAYGCDEQAQKCRTFCGDDFDCAGGFECQASQCFPLPGQYDECEPTGSGGSSGGGTGGGGAGGTGGSSGSGGTGGTPVDCSSTTSSAQCFSCCGDAYPEGHQAFLAIGKACLCQPSVCGVECGSSVCADTPPISTACQACLDAPTADQCNSVILDNCSADPDCQAYYGGCVQASGCSSKP
jgi:hypothetical protein